MHRAFSTLSPLMLLAVGGGSVAAQTTAPTTRIEFDATTKEFAKLPGHLNFGSTVTLIVNNPNTFREGYVLGINSSDFHANSIPSALSTIIAGVQETTTPADEAAHANAFAEPAASDRAKDYSRQITKIRSEIRLLNAMVNNGNLDQGMRRDLYYGATNTEIRKLCILRAGNFLRLVNSLLPANQKPFYTDHVEDFTITMQDLQDRNDLPRDRLSRLQFKASLIESSVEGAHTLAVTTLPAELEALNSAASALKMSSPPDSAETARIDPILTRLRKDAEAAIAAWTSQEEQIKAHYQNAAKMFAYVVDFVQTPDKLVKRVAVRGDAMTFTITCTPLSIKDPLANGANGANGADPPSPAAPPANTSSAETTLPVYGRTGFDFALGMVATNLTSPHYTLTGSNTAPTVTRASGDGVNFGPAALGFYHLYSSGQFKMGPAIGLTTTDNPRYLLGMGLTFGHRDRVSLVFGAAFGNVDRLSRDRVGSTLIGSSPTLESSVPTNSVMRAGLFAGLTFTFTFK